MSDISPEYEAALKQLETLDRQRADLLAQLAVIEAANVPPAPAPVPDPPAPAPAVVPPPPPPAPAPVKPRPDPAILPPRQP